MEEKKLQISDRFIAKRMNEIESLQKFRGMEPTNENIAEVLRLAIEATPEGYQYHTVLNFFGNGTWFLYEKRNTFKEMFGGE